MKVGLFVPCYIDQFYPQVAIATIELLERLGVDVSYPKGQTCCGQPMANAGFEHLTKQIKTSFQNNFSNTEIIICPSGSCTLHAQQHLLPNSERKRVYELTEFLVDRLGVSQLPVRFPHRVGLHQSCHGLRGLHLAQMSELVASPFSKPLSLLKMIRDLEIVPLDQVDECCGFGGTFSVSEEAVSVKMGRDRIKDHFTHGAEYITSVDMSCLMHLDGILRRSNSPVKVVHIAEILNGSVNKSLPA
jgi:L-lactate dehydrogenase complex protein LldE